MDPTDTDAPAPTCCAPLCYQQSDTEIEAAERRGFKTGAAFVTLLVAAGFLLSVALRTAARLWRPFL